MKDKKCFYIKMYYNNQMTDSPNNLNRLVHKGFYTTNLSFEEVFDKLGRYEEEGMVTVIEHLKRHMFEFSETYAEIVLTSYGMKPSYLISKLKNYEKVYDEDSLNLIDHKIKNNYLFRMLISEPYFKNIEKKKNEIAQLIPNSKIVKESIAIEAGWSFVEVSAALYLGIEILGKGIDILGKIDGSVGGGTIIYNSIKKILKKTPTIELSRKVNNLIIKKIKKEFNDECCIEKDSYKLHENLAITCVCYSNNNSVNKYNAIYNPLNNKVEIIKLLK